MTRRGHLTSTILTLITLGILTAGLSATTVNTVNTANTAQTASFATPTGDPHALVAVDADQVETHVFRCLRAKGYTGIPNDASDTIIYAPSTAIKECDTPLISDYDSRTGTLFPTGVYTV